jgi:hypothetical protein
LAHEIGHVMLASRSHSRNGLMRAMIDAEQFVRPGIELFGLDTADVRNLRAVQLASCKLARATPTPVAAVP